MLQNGPSIFATVQTTKMKSGQTHEWVAGSSDHQGRMCSVTGVITESSQRLWKWLQRHNPACMLATINTAMWPCHTHPHPISTTNSLRNLLAISGHGDPIGRLDVVCHRSVVFAIKIDDVSQTKLQQSLQQDQGGVYEILIICEIEAVLPSWLHIVHSEMGTMAQTYAYIYMHTLNSHGQQGEDKYYKHTLLTELCSAVHKYTYMVRNRTRQAKHRTITMKFRLNVAIPSLKPLNKN